MMKRNISLSLLMIALSAGLNADGNNYPLLTEANLNSMSGPDASSSSLVNFETSSMNGDYSPRLQLYSPPSAFSPRSHSGLDYSSDTSSTNSDSYSYSPSLQEASRGNYANLLTAPKSMAAQAQAIAMKAQDIITRSFAAMDSWIAKPAAFTQYDSALLTDGDGNYISNSGESVIDSKHKVDLTKLTIDRSANFKISAVMKQIDIAFMNIEKATNGANTRPIKDAVMRAITAFSTTSTITTEGTISNKVLAGIVNSAKTVMLAPIKLAVKAAALGTGMAAGAVGGAAAGLGAGVNRTAKDIMRTRSRNNLIKVNGADSAMTKAAKLIPNTIYKALTGIVDTAALTAYSAAEGLVVGGVAGAVIGNSVAGDTWGLAVPVNEKVLEMGDGEMKKAYEDIRGEGVSHAQAVKVLSAIHTDVTDTYDMTPEETNAALKTAALQVQKNIKEMNQAKQAQSTREQQSRF